MLELYIIQILNSNLKYNIAHTQMLPFFIFFLFNKKYIHLTKLTPKYYFLFPVVYIYLLHNRNYCYNEL